MKKSASALVLLLIICSLMVTLPNVEIVTAAEDSWAIMEPMPTARTGLGVAVVNEKIYAIGGYGDGYLNINEEYDPATNTWTTREPMPTPRASFGIAVVENKIYVIGGAIGFNSTTEEVITCSFNQVYDPLTDSWETKESMPTNRSPLDANVVDSKIYLIGGRTGGQYTTVALNQVYDPETDAWTTKEPIPYPVVGYASAVFEGKIFVLGGQDEYHDLINLDLTQIYDSETDMWSQGTPIPTATVAAAAGATEGTMASERIYVMGGDGGFFYPLDRNYVYDPQADVWNTGTAIPTPRINPAVAVVNDLVYVIGGTSGSGGLQSTPTAAVEQYTPADYIPEFPSWTPLLIMLVTVLAVAIVYKRKIQKQGRRKQ